MNEKILFLFITFILSNLFLKSVFSNDQFNVAESLKNNLIKNQLLLNSYYKCEEYIYKPSVELFLNCNKKFQNNEKHQRKIII